MRRFWGLLLTLLMCVNIASLANDRLERASVASQGIDERGLMNFIDTLCSLKNSEIHHIMVVRGGKVVAEAHFSPFGADDVHNLYSCSKTVTALAVGIAADKGLLSLSDRVVDFFPDKIPQDADSLLHEITIQHLLTMTSGIRKDSLTMQRYSDWVLGWMEQGMTATPGAKWDYDTMSTFMLSAIIQKVTGMRLLNFLNENLFHPMGIIEADWEESPGGINTGGWGLRLNTESQAKLGLLMLNYGQWKGRNLVSRKWVDDMTRCHKRFNEKKARPPKSLLSKIKYYLRVVFLTIKGWFTGEEPIENVFWDGYGYQIKILHHPSFESFFAIGLYGQTIFVDRKRDLVVVVNGAAAGYGNFIKAIWNVLYPACLPKPRGESGLQPDVEKKLNSLEISPVKGEFNNTNTAGYASGKEHRLAGNELGWRKFSVAISDSVCTLKVTQDDNTTMTVACGYNRWNHNTVTVTPPSDLKAKNAFGGLKGDWDIAGSFAWTGPHMLDIHLLYTNWVTSRHIVVDFWHDEISITDNFMTENKQTVMFN